MWDSVEPAWRECFLGAWESFRAGSVPVGSVLVDPRGAVVSRGRNRFNETAGPPGEVVGSHIAHAEINALATLPYGDHGDHVLYSTLEPCLLCTAALRFSHVGTVRFAAEDPLWHSMDRIPELNEHIARRWTRREGPRSGWLRTLGAVLPLISSVERGTGSVLDAHEVAMPDVLALARRVAPDAGRLRSVDFDEGVAEILAAGAADMIGA